MKPLIIAVTALAVFFLVLSMVATAPAAAPASSLDRCMMCHPKAHPAGWAGKLHATDVETGKVPMTECTRCHDLTYCTDCHAQELGQQGQ